MALNNPGPFHSLRPNTRSTQEDPLRFTISLPEGQPETQLPKKSCPMCRGTGWRHEKGIWYLAAAGGGGARWTGNCKSCSVEMSWIYFRGKRTNYYLKTPGCQSCSCGSEPDDVCSDD